jgi:hypothetical protein
VCVSFCEYQELALIYVIIQIGWSFNYKHTLGLSELQITECCFEYINGAFGSLHFKGIGIHSIK